MKISQFRLHEYCTIPSFLFTLTWFVAQGHSFSIHTFSFLYLFLMEPVWEPIKQGEFTIKLKSRPLIVNIIRMEKSILLWIGSPFNTSLSNLAVSIDSQYDVPPTSTLLSCNVLFPLSL